MDIPFDVWKLIFDACDVYTAIQFASTCKDLWFRLGKNEKIARWRTMTDTKRLLEAAAIGDARIISAVYDRQKDWSAVLISMYRLSRHHPFSAAYVYVFEKIPDKSSTFKEYIRLGEVVRGDYRGQFTITYATQEDYYKGVYYKACRNGDFELAQFLYSHLSAYFQERFGERARPPYYRSVDESIRSGDLKLVKWACEKFCDDVIGGKAAAVAVRYGHMEILQWLEENMCLIGSSACIAAAQTGRLEMLQWLRERRVIWNKKVCHEAVIAGHLHVLIWARANGALWRWGHVWRAAKKRKNKEIIEWLQSHRSVN